LDKQIDVATRFLSYTKQSSVEGRRDLRVALCLDSQYAQVYSLFAYLQLLVFFFRFSSVVSGRSSGPGFIIEVNPQR